MAEARSAVAELRVKEIEEGHNSTKDIIRAWRKALVRRFYRTRNSIHNGMWPTSISNLIVAVVIFLLLLLCEPDFTSSLNKWLWQVDLLLHLPRGLPRTLRAIFIACIISFVFFLLLMKIRQYILRMLLSYRGWMYEYLRTQSKWTLLWCCMVKLVSGYQPSLYSCQRSLPRMPVPALRDTLKKLMVSLKPICSDEEIQVLKKQSKEFEATVGPKLQKILILKSWLSQNYVSDWWEKYVYLRSRSPLPINSNYYCFDHSYWTPTNSQAARTAAVIYNCMNFKRLIDREELHPLMLRNTVPMCMAQYERILSTVRIPGEDMDEVVHIEPSHSKHVVMMSRGIYYKVSVYDSSFQLLCPATLEQQVQWILEDSKKQAETVSDEEKSLAALTSLGRTRWAKLRKTWLSTGVNKESLDAVEKSVFFIALLDLKPTSLTERANLLLCGNGSSVWFDKSLSVQIFGNARCGMNCEHSMADAPALAHMWEYVMTKEVLEKQYDEDGSCMPPHRPFKQATVKTPQRLVWEVVPEFAEEIRSALQFAKKNSSDIDLVLHDHDKWGKGEIKKCKVSPDAFVQMALQLAYYKETKQFPQTYEACMTRMYLWGRTETVRSCTPESSDFVRAMMENSISKNEKIRLLKRAAEVHQKMYRDAMNGMGIDRHLFALYVACKGLNYESEFLENIIHRPWTLSTSQTPHTQLTTTPDPNLKTFSNKLGPGGGFGPVSDDGYGVSYVIPNDHKFFFHVSSKRSCPQTSSERFVQLIFDSLEEMRNLYSLEGL